MSCYAPGVGLRAAIAITALCASASGSGCGNRGSGGGPPGEGVAGVVLEVEGQATARAAAAPAPRPLAVGSELAADDTVETAADASLRLRLYHNRALLALEGGKSIVLRDSAAWGAQPAPADPFERSGGSTVTTVAGRQAEGTGADTRATATPPVGVTAPVEPPPDRPMIPTDKPRPKDTSSGPKSDPKKLDPPKGGGGCDEVACLISPDQPCCKTYRKGGGGGGGNNTIAPAEGPLVDHQIREVINPIVPAMRACADQLPEKTKVTFKVAFKIAPSGSITSVELEPTQSAAVTGCVKSAARRAKFPPAAAPTSFKLPLTLERP